MIDEKEDEEISFDFGKIKNIFKKKDKEIIEDKSEDKPNKEESKDKIKKDEDSDEEMSFDLGKIKSFFKKKPEKLVIANQKEKIDNKDSEEEISLDFGKIKSFFKKEDGPKKEESDEDISFDLKNIFKIKKGKDEEVPVNWSSIQDFFKKYAVIFLILIPIILGAYFRVQPQILPITDDWASNSVYNFYINNIRAQVDQQYPNLPDVNKESLVNEQFQKFLSENKDRINNEIRDNSNYIKSALKNDKGQTYLIEMDPYYWMRHARNIIDHGYPGDEIRDNVQWDNHMLAPVGRPVPNDMLHAYFEAYLFRFLRFFNGDLELMQVAFYMPIIVSILSVFPAFFIGRRIAGNFGGFIAATLIVIHPANLTRTIGGFADTDSYNIFFPLIIAWLFFEALEAKKIKNSLILGSLCGFLIGLYSFAWGGWWNIFLFILAASIIYLIYLAMINLKKNIFKQKSIQKTVLFLVIFFIFSIIFTTLFSGFDIFIGSFRGPSIFIKLKEVAITTVWPNVYTTVAEQNPSSFNDVVSQMGGKILFSLAIMGLIFAFFKRDDEKNFDIKYSLLIGIWFFSALYASIKGARFSFMLVPAFGLGFGVAMGFFYKYISNWISKELHINLKVIGTILVLLLFLPILAPLKGAKAVAGSEIPGMNDVWWNSLSNINQQSEKNAIINSWWDFGHWFKYIGDRAVTFDGTSQESPMAHWIGKVLLTDNETMAVGILRMADCGSNNAFDELNKILNDHPKSIKILYEIIVKPKEDAKNILKGYGLIGIEAENILKYTHCDPPEDYFITSEDMVSKSGVWAHFGSWNFEKALIYNTLKKPEYQNNKDLAIKFLQERFNYSLNEADNLYIEVDNIRLDRDANSWIAPWPSYASSIEGCRKLSEDMAQCSFGQGAVDVNLTTAQADIKGPQEILHPNSVVVVEKDGLLRKDYNENTVGFSIDVIPSGDGYSNVIMSPELAESMFTRLFFTDGHGLRYFKKFSDERTIFGGRIIVWKIDWNGTAANIKDEFKPKNETKFNITETNISNESNGA